METMGAKKQTNVLVIEDDRDMNDLICAALSSVGYATSSSYTGEDGLEKAMTDKPDVILLDVRLPNIDGLEVCRTLAGSVDTKAIPIIMVTEKTDISTKISSYIAGAKRYVTKPFGVNELLKTIDKTLGDQSIFTDKVPADEPPLD